MTIRTFIRKNRTEIDQSINNALYRYNEIPSPPPKRNDDEREQWIANDEGLYNWARTCGVKV